MRQEICLLIRERGSIYMQLSFQQDPLYFLHLGLTRFHHICPIPLFISEIIGIVFSSLQPNDPCKTAAQNPLLLITYFYSIAASVEQKQLPWGHIFSKAISCNTRSENMHGAILIASTILIAS